MLDLIRVGTNGLRLRECRKLVEVQLIICPERIISLLCSAPFMRKSTVLLMATLLLATSMAGCIGERYLDRLVGEDTDEKDRECDKECFDECRESGGTEEECKERCAERDDREQEDGSDGAEMTEEECEEEGGTWTYAPDREKYYCDMSENDSEDDSGEEDRTSESDEQEDETCYDENRQEVPCEEESE